MFVHFDREQGVLPKFVSPVQRERHGQTFTQIKSTLSSRTDISRHGC